MNFSAQFFEPWYNQYHPYKNNSDAPLWIARANRLKNLPIEKQSYTIWTSWRILKRAEKIVNKVPSAELYPGQTDEEELGASYEDIDEILKKIVNNEDVDSELAKKMRKRIKDNEHKRKMPMVLKVS